MLVRISCATCHLECLWTDDPKTFLESVCVHRRRCRAQLIGEEGFAKRTEPRSDANAPSARLVHAGGRRLSAIVA